MKGRWWTQPLIGALAAFVFYLPFLYLKRFDLESLVYLLAVTVVTFAIGIGVIARRIIVKRWASRRFLVAVAAFCAVTILMFWRTEGLRPWARWLVASERYKQAVLRQAPGRQSGLRHIEWDGWGWAGMDTSVELVYDPTDSLEQELKQNPKGRFADVAARTAKIERLGKGWYSVTLFTSEAWGADD